ncbi:ferredoxin [Herbidospora galbida]|uniref:Ferredoxin n=1 Tax=Herbidospora galbida TaxID=2575442 RepID=A0A4U3MFZ6_9ACTN|nr:ferredoxin [Herbidospora galbida]TKK88101.1 ferredoxin [Herbidospora galbida]
MIVTVDRERCCSSGQCALIAPEVFDQNDEDGTVLLLQPEPAEDLHDAVEDAADHCPCSAISLS